MTKLKQMVMAAVEVKLLHNLFHYTLLLYITARHELCLVVLIIAVRGMTLQFLFYSDTFSSKRV